MATAPRAPVNSSVQWPSQTEPVRPGIAWSVIILVAFSSLLYMVTMQHAFVGDDTFLILRNPRSLSFQYLREVFSGGMWDFWGPQLRLSYYRPLILVTYSLERSLFGVNAAWFHLVNVILNSTVVALVYLLGRRLWGSGRVALWSALLFAALPVHVENVAPATGITDLECAAFFLAAFQVYTRPLNESGLLPRRAAWGAGALFFLAALAKEAALALPVLAVFYEHFLRQGGPEKFSRRLARYAPMLFFLALYFALRIHAFGGLTKGSAASAAASGSLVLSGLDLTGQYARVLVWPLHLALYRAFRPPESWWDPDVLLGVGGLILAGVAFGYFWNRRRIVSFSVFWFFLTLGPVLNVRWLPRTAYGERFLYLPSVAFCWMVAAATAQLRAPKGRSPLLGSLVWVLPLGLVAMAALRTGLRLPDWRDDETLAAATVREAPDAAPYIVNLGVAHARRGEHDSARREFIAALALDRRETEAAVNLAIVLLADGHPEGARAELERAGAANPLSAEVPYNLGLLDMEQGKYAQARERFERAIELDPNYAEALNNLGLLLLGSGEIARAHAMLERSLLAKPDFADAHNNLGLVFKQIGDLRRAESEFERALELAPGSERPALNLAEVCELQGNSTKALEVYRAAVRARPDSALAQFRLGTLALHLGRGPEAIAALERAVALRPNSAAGHTQLARAYLVIGDRQAAERELRAALLASPQDEQARTVMRLLQAH